MSRPGPARTARIERRAAARSSAKGNAMVVPDAIAQLSRDDLTGEMRLARSADVAALITARRKELGWTRTGLAERAGVSHPTVSMVESGKRKAGMETTLLLFAALSLELWAFPRAVEETS